MKLNKLTIKQAQEKMEQGEISSVDITRDCLERMRELNDKLNAVLTFCEEEAMKEAELADERRAKGETGPLLGIPYIAKDNILTKGVRTTAASKILDNYIAPYDATIIKKLRKAGAVLLGKANMDEFAHGASGENSAYGATHNPWDLTRVAGGSSSGPAAVVASDMCLFAMGTDTGGSVRCPASFCNLTGLKPTYGRSSRFGLVSMTSSTDVPGPITKDVADAEIVLSVMEGIDEHDATTVDAPATKMSQSNIKRKKIGVPEEFFKGTDEKILKIVNDAIAKFKEQGAEIVPITLPHAKYGIPVYYIITPSEVSSNLARFDGIRYGFSDVEAKNLLEVYKQSRGKGFGPEAKRRIMLGTFVLSAGYFDAYYLKAQKVRTKIKDELDRELEKVDIIITPTQPDIAFKIGDQSDDPLKMYLEDIFLSPASLAGLPAISIPGGFVDEMPVGIQLIGKRFDETTLFAFGKKYQEVTDWHQKKALI
ncbi:Asp-tRNA(Asn)/Glu-tRNA(Gln) amidotransferase subunit GatA [Candidatus Parcubacteria bacterium]|nr:Asp-tRNA(Asn)/Glu-tRNA(Gln) amidotransferase subunit GatA [Patescibacteria group bacterium]MBU4309265.1 Asp-tRNA(Asn)/Glu-tRNA(Gln) amidotransferase subunit GatA [Patescibacteria group bacterium]MBU4432494.1 Asp-tRNA(Asn)/Glu-tRNA(Gln) amidotransferase subunit GatA [Patescibacteria group bacterium]MBU4577626.1 Asp-tRNA(Asn)/Glu-tRNA(Gln) amidotransferase subunit GatA [Patescibacteria group bacterium]MCG2697312.1 Asp-tRNA(Asn)/Glu-tRNA(Gln) amidotransferase subunit GatA [Candidatus Parcubacte